MRDYFSSIIENAIRLANYWHQGQKRRESDFDYFTHLTAVGMILSQADCSEEVIAAGFCHHLFSASDCPSEEVMTVLGQKIYHIVEVLTENDKAKNDEEWKVEKQKYIEKVKNSSEEIKMVCVADRIANLHVMMEVLEEKGLIYFEKFFVGPEEVLWYEDNLCMMLSESWEHPLLKEYDALIDKFVDFLEELDQGEEIEEKEENEEIILAQQIGNFDKPIKEKTDYQKRPILKKVEKKQPAPLPSINKINKRKKKNSLKADDATKGFYLSDDEFDLLLPAVLQLCISQERINNTMLQKRLKINYLTGYRVLKELKRKHVIKKADSFYPRKVNVKRACEILKNIRS